MLASNCLLPMIYRVILNTVDIEYCGYCINRTTNCTSLNRTCFEVQTSESTIIFIWVLVELAHILKLWPVDIGNCHTAVFAAL